MTIVEQVNFRDSHREAGYTAQRKFAPWIGGSIIGSLATHSELKISRQEWEEGAESSLSRITGFSIW